MIGGEGYQRVVRVPMGLLLSDVERDIEHLWAELDIWAEKHGLQKRKSIIIIKSKIHC